MEQNDILVETPPFILDRVFFTLRNKAISSSISEIIEDLENIDANFKLLSSDKNPKEKILQSLLYLLSLLGESLYTKNFIVGIIREIITRTEDIEILHLFLEIVSSDINDDLMDKKSHIVNESMRVGLKNIMLNIVKGIIERQISDLTKKRSPEL